MTSTDEGPGAGRQHAVGLDRRQLLAAGGLAGLGTLGTPFGTEGAFAAPKADPVTMAMHVHGSFSEGIGSMAAHLDQAKRVGVDVIWWTDHDFRRTAYGYRDAIRFDGAREPADSWDLSWAPSSTPEIASAGHSFVSTPANPDESGDKLRVHATAASGAGWGTHLVQAVSQNSMYSTSYSDTTLVVDVRPERVGSAARGVIEIASSYRPASGGRPAGQYRIQYRIGEPAGHSTEEGGLLGVVGIPAGPADQWQRLRLDLRSDHAALWPDTVAEDASLWRLRLGVRVRDGADARVLFDRLRFERDRAKPADSTALLLDVMRQYRSRYPTVRQYAAAEISLVLHLNAFGGDGTLPAYTGDPVKSSSVAAQRQMVDFLHDHGAVVSINHPLQGAASDLDLASRLITTRGVGADVIEIGTGKPTEKLIRVFDIAARNAVFLTANGTTDDHEGTDWLKGRRWVTGVWSPTKRRGDLCDALRAGRAWFFDPLRWDGGLDLRVEGTRSMGGVLFTSKARVDVRVRAADLPRGATVELVRGRCDLAGPSRLAPANSVRRVSAQRFASGRWSTGVRRGDGAYVRAAVRAANGDLIAFSNPVWVLPESRRGEIRVPRPRR